jgi:MYXO-CTERM domain-containing protein
VCCAAIGLLLGPVPVPSGASAANPGIQLSTNVLVPGHTLVITGSGWTHTASVNATICGADAVSGTADCAVTSTATMGATARGLLWSHIAIVIPPAPCPCVVQVSGTNITFTEKIPVKVVGAPTRPVQPAATESPPTLKISGLEVVGGATLASFFGGRAPRTLEFRLRNTWDHAVSPVLLGRWGQGKDLPNVIEMPSFGSLGPGQTRELKVPFSLTALSIGSYTVAVRVQLVGYPREFAATTTTSQWPIGLFLLGLLLLVLLAYLVAIRRRRKETAEPAATDDGAPGEPSPESEPQEDLTLA